MSNPSVNSSPFMGVSKYEHPKYDVREEDIVEYVRVDVLVSHDPNDKEAFITEEQVKEKSRVNRQAYIDSFRDDVGIKNILKKLALTGDTSLINQVQRAAMPIDQNDPEKREIVQDFTPLAGGEASAAALGDQAYAIYKSLPQELLKGRSYEEFISSVNQEEINSWIATMKAAQGDKGGNQDE